MKLTKYAGLLLSGLVISSSAAFAANTLYLTAGACLNQANSAVADGTLWVLIVDNSATAGALPQLGMDSSITSSGASYNQSPFWYSTLSLGTVLQGDTVFAMGGVDSGAAGFAGGIQSTVSAVYGTNGVTSGRNFGLYWFPGVTYTPEVTSYKVAWGLGHEVGGIQTTTGETGLGLGGFTLAADTGSDYFPAALSVMGGSTPATSFQAVSIIPEPSSMLLGALGALGLLRRRR